MNKKFHEAKGFYLTLIASLFLGLLLDFVGFSPIQALIYTAVLYGLTVPPLIGAILHIGNNKKVMGIYTNGKTLNIPGFTALIIMTATAAILIYLQLTDT